MRTGFVKVRKKRCSRLIQNIMIQSFIDRDIRDIAKYGIAFYGKKVEIAM